MNFTSFSCSAGSLAATVPCWPKRTQSEKPLNASTLLVAAVTRDLSGASEVAQQLDGADDLADLAEGRVGGVAAGAGPQPPQQQDGGMVPSRIETISASGPGSGLDQAPIDDVAPGLRRCARSRGARGAEEQQVLQVADAGYQVDTEQVGDSEDRLVLALGVRVDRDRADLGNVLQ